MEKLFLASLNKAKVEATRQVFDNFCVVPIEVKLDISQPLSEEETILCAKKRASLLESGYRLGLEAGVTKILDKCFLVNYGVLIDPEGNEYYAGGTYLELPKEIEEELYQNHLELKDAMIKHFGNVLKETGGAIEVLTKGEVSRVDIFTHITKLLKGELERKKDNA